MNMNLSLIDNLARGTAGPNRRLLRCVQLTRAGKSFHASPVAHEIRTVNLSRFVIKLQALPNGNHPARSKFYRSWLELWAE